MIQLYYVSGVKDQVEGPDDHGSWLCKMMFSTPYPPGHARLF